MEFVDEATPLSYERYTGNWQGATSGFLLTKETLPMMIQGVPKTLPGLRDFYMAGQWVEPGGSVPLVGCLGPQRDPNHLRSRRAGLHRRLPVNEKPPARSGGLSFQGQLT